MTVHEDKHAFTLQSHIIFTLTLFRLSYSIQWSDPAQSSTVVVVIVVVVVQATLLFSSSTLLAISLELYFIASCDAIKIYSCSIYATCILLWLQHYVQVADVRTIHTCKLHTS